ncbi:hypothetical protein FEF26_08285 [Nesterenkonia salmonea]|uniref:DUF308 domain-containing protein n=1 Tax=Nesterenkonia salmonea TaxID=1804987 RepID=A0A5R9BAF6_9MICC|nr:hypothetical protein [Nesterenkonia salmonea]TLP96972.1 hypothetical protein FEF26_08285 [Nesterenkonia salmonea]
MPVTRIDPQTAAALVRPAWMRAVVTTVFAVLTIFWTDETMTLARIALAAFFILCATAVWDYVKTEQVPPKLTGAAALGAAAWVLSGIAALFAATPTALAIIAGVGFLIMGACELYGGLKVRAEFVPSRDHIILGVVGVLTGVGLFLGAGLDPHGILGISGMGVIIMAVLLLISAAGLTHEASKRA